LFSSLFTSLQLVFMILECVRGGYRQVTVFLSVIDGQTARAACQKSRDRLAGMSDDPMERVRRLCLALPGTSEKQSHGEPTFFAGKKVFVMCANNHHGDGRMAIWLPVPPGAQAGLIASEPATFFDPPYVGKRGWVGINLHQVSDDELRSHIQVAWELIAPKKLVAQFKP
jgi:hypothetical protein